jgi:hypothetical protein
MIPAICQQYKDANSVLQTTSVAWARLDCSNTDVDQMSTAWAPEVRVLVLQQSPDGRAVYGAVLAADPAIRAVGKLVLSSADRAELRAIAKGLQAFRIGLSKLLLRYCDDAGEIGDMLPKEGEEPSSQQQPDVDSFEGDLTKLVMRMNALLTPLFGEAFSLALGDLSQNHVVVVADVELLELPLEALGIVQGAASIARDFSLHMLHARTTGKLPAACTSMLSKGNATQPAAKDSNMAYIIDARNEDSSADEGQRMTMSDTWKELTTSGKQISQRPADTIKGQEHIPSPGEWQHLLQSRRNGGLLYYGMGRATAYCPPELIAGLDLSACNIVCLIDQAESDASNRRQSKLDNQKTAAALALEQPLQAAALFSLAGVNAVLLNRWASSLHMNARLMRRVVPAMTQAKDSIGMVLQSEIRPPPPAPEGEEEAGKPPPKKGKKDKSKRPELDLPLKDRVRFNTVVYGLPFMRFEK